MNNYFDENRLGAFRKGAYTCTLDSVRLYICLSFLDPGCSGDELDEWGQRVWLDILNIYLFSCIYRLILPSLRPTQSI